MLAGGGGEGWCAGGQAYIVGVNARVWTDVRECGRPCEGGWYAGGQVCVVDVQAGRCVWWACMHECACACGEERCVGE